MTDEIQISKALAILERVVAFICKEPDKLEMVTGIGSTKVAINFNVGNADDSIRIVGGRGKGLEHLQRLASVLFEDAGVEPVIGRIVNLDASDKLDFKKYAPNPKWPKAQLLKLVEDIFESIGCDVRVKANDMVDSTWFIVTATDIDERILNTIKIADKIFAVIGQQQGRRITLDARKS